MSTIVHLYPFISQDHPVSRRLDSRAAFCCVGTGAATWPLQPCTAWCQAPLLDLMLLLSALAWHWWVLGCAQISLLRYWVNHWRDLAALHEEKRCKSARELWPIGRNASPDCPQPLSKKLHCSSFWTAGSLRIVAWRCWLESAWTLACGAWKAWAWAPSCPSIDCNFRWCHRSVLSLSFFNLAPCFSLFCYDMLHCFTSRVLEGFPMWMEGQLADSVMLVQILSGGRLCWNMDGFGELVQCCCKSFASPEDKTKIAKRSKRKSLYSLEGQAVSMFWETLPWLRWALHTKWTGSSEAELQLWDYTVLHQHFVPPWVFLSRYQAMTTRLSSQEAMLTLFCGPALNLSSWNRTNI